MADLTLAADAGRNFAGVVPETLAEAEQLATAIERAVQLETDHGIADLAVEVGRDGILLTGRCSSYYAKQLAQHAVMAMPCRKRLTNNIEVD